jgi:hypothetical protein
VKRWNDQSGANAVEFALVLPVLIVLLFGILYGGLAWNQALTLNQAAREGARFGATYDFDADPAGWYAAVRSRVISAGSGHLAAGDICIRFVSGGSPEGPADSCVVEGADALSGSEDRVEVQVSRPARLELIFYGFDLQITRDAVARYEGRVGDNNGG